MMGNSQPRTRTFYIKCPPTGMKPVSLLSDFNEGRQTNHSYEKYRNAVLVLDFFLHRRELSQWRLLYSFYHDTSSLKDRFRSGFWIFCGFPFYIIKDVASSGRTDQRSEGRTIQRCAKDLCSMFAFAGASSEMPGPPRACLRPDPCRNSFNDFI